MFQLEIHMFSLQMALLNYLFHKKTGLLSVKQYEEAQSS